MWVRLENVARATFKNEDDDGPARARNGYLRAIGVAIVLGSLIGLLAATLLPKDNAEKMSAAIVSPVQAAPSLAALELGASTLRAAPRLLFPESATALGSGGPYAGESPIRAPSRAFAARPKPVIDQLDLPLADTVTLLATATPVPIIEPIIEMASASGAPDRVAIGVQAPRIAIVLDDLGLDEKATRRAIALPRSITLSFLPYGRASSGLAEEGLARGHEIMVHIPMEPEGDADPGPNALMVNQPADEISSRLAAQLDEFPGAIGFNNHMGSLFTADVRALLPVMREARARGLLFLDSRTTANTFAARVAEAAGAKVLSRDVFLDHAAGADGLLAQLAEVEKTARMTGSAIAIGHPHKLTLDVLEVWTRGLKAKGFDLVSISAMLAPGTNVEPGLLASSGL